MDPIEFLNSVSAVDVNIEVDRRNSTSRTYYCLFHSVLSLFNHVPSYVGLRTHENLYSFLLSGQCPKEYCPNKLKSIAYALRATKYLRTDADYDLDTVYPIQSAVTAAATVKSCLKKITELSDQKAA